MDFLDRLKDSLSDDVVVTHDFLLSYCSTESAAHAFFEGKTDESFYGTYIRSLMPDGWSLKTYICGNKDSVYYHFQKLSRNHKKDQPLLFFVDKDIEDIIPFERTENEIIHVTKYYSVENYIVTDTNMEIIWAEIFKQGSGNNIAKSLIESFSNALKTTHSILLDMMAWVIYHRRKGSRPNLDCILTKELFQIDDSLLLSKVHTQSQLYIYLDGKTKVVTDNDSYKEIDKVRAELDKYDPKEVVRGHNEMDFMIEFYKKLKLVVANESENKIKPIPDITKSNVLDILSPRTPMPDSLRGFLNHHFASQLALV